MLMIWSLHQSLNLITPLSCTSVKLISKLLLMKGLKQSHFISWWNMIVPVSVGLLLIVADVSTTCAR